MDNVDALVCVFSLLKIIEKGEKKSGSNCKNTEAAEKPSQESKLQVGKTASLSGQEHVIVFQRTRVQFPVPTYGSSQLPGPPESERGNVFCLHRYLH